MQQRSGEPYFACPFCLTEITSADEQTGSEEQTREPTVFENLTKSHDCKKHFGYLGERPPKAPVPDECMMCKLLVQCMLKKASE